MRSQSQRTCIRFGRLAIDEAHLITGSNVEGSKIFHDQHQATQWMITGTPFDTSITDMRVWIEHIEKVSSHRGFRWDRPKPDKEDTWDERKKWRQDLKACQPSCLNEVRLIHAKFIKGKTVSPEDFQRLIKTLRAIYSCLVIRRTLQSTFGGEPLLELPPNDHSFIDCKLRAEYDDLLIQEETQVIQNLIERLARDRKGDRERDLEEPSQLKITTVISNMYRLRIWSSWPALMECDDTKNLHYTLKELQAKKWLRDQNCIQPKGAKKTLYELAKSTTCPYQKNLSALCAIQNNPKIEALQHLMDHIWKKDDKAIFFCANNVSGYIVYWYLRNVRNSKVAFAYSGWSKHKQADVVHLFQEDDTTILDKWSPVQYLIGTSILGTGLDLFKANRLVQWDPEWGNKIIKQNQSRIWRHGQQQIACTYQMCVTNAKAELLLYDSCERKRWIEDVCERADSENSLLNEAPVSSGDPEADQADHRDDDSEDSEIESTEASVAGVSLEDPSAQ
ncbi:MAG: hypothetical protein Q9204_007611 [Flavoplaca sp. TL-2023a]